MTRALLLVDHGSRREAANLQLAETAALVAAHLPEVIVEIAHMELAPPTIGEGVAACLQRGASEIIVVPYMLSAGRHAMEDIPRLLQEATASGPRVPVRVTDPLGVHPKLAELVLIRAGLVPDDRLA